MDHERFADLPDFGTVERFSPKRDGECFSDLATVLNRHGKTERFQITLLHTHFDVADDETLVEYVDTRKRQIVKTVWPQEHVRSDMQCVHWRLTETGLHSLELSSSPEQYDRPTLAASDYRCLENMQSVLAKHGAGNRFGVALSSRFTFDPSRELPLERTDVRNRILTTKIISTAEIVNRGTFQPKDIVYTGWEVIASAGWRATTKCTVTCIAWGCPIKEPLPMPLSEGSPGGGFRGRAAVRADRERLAN
jgi:hypothetical protein